MKTNRSHPVECEMIFFIFFAFHFVFLSCFNCLCYLLFFRFLYFYLSKIIFWNSPTRYSDPRFAYKYVYSLFVFDVKKKLKYIKFTVIFFFLPLRPQIESILFTKVILLAFIWFAPEANRRNDDDAFSMKQKQTSSTAISN